MQTKELNKKENLNKIQQNIRSGVNSLMYLLKHSRPELSIQLENC